MILRLSIKVDNKMIYKFSDIYNQEMYRTANILFILGSYDIFNNIVVDECRKRCIPNEDEEIDKTFLNMIANDLPTGSNNTNQSDSSMNVLEFKEFMDLNRTYPLEGRWFCNVNYKELKTKEKDSLKEYIKVNSDTGLLIVNIRDFQDYREYLRNRTFQTSQVAHIIQLTFPNRNMLTEILNSEFRKNNVIVNDKAIQLFILRLSNDYNSYYNVISDISEKHKGTTIGYDDMLESLKGIDNYVLDDFLAEMTKGVRNSKLRTNRKIYKMYKSLLDSMTAREIVTKLNYKVDMMLELRVAINNGTLPILVRYGAKEAQDKLPEDSKVKSLSTFTFKKYAKIASLTSLKDWYYIKMMLKGNSYMGARGGTSNSNDAEQEYKHILLSVIHRTTFCPNRLMNDMGILNVIEEELYDLNTVFYNENVHMTEDAMLEIIKRNSDDITRRDFERSEFGKELEKKLKGTQRKKGKTKSDLVDSNELASNAAKIQELLNKQRL